MLYFAETYPDLARQYLAHSKIPMYEIPLAVTLMGFTTIVNSVLKQGKLYTRINTENSVTNVVNELYSAITWWFFTKYIKTQSNV
jgi:hypothetical protein